MVVVEETTLRFLITTVSFNNNQINDDKVISKISIFEKLLLFEKSSFTFSFLSFKWTNLLQSFFLIYFLFIDVYISKLDRHEIFLTCHSVFLPSFKKLKKLLSDTSSSLCFSFIFLR